MSARDPSSEGDELALRLRLDAQAGPAQRISKDRARELVAAAMASARGAEVEAQAPSRAQTSGHWRMSVAAAALLAAFVSGASASLWVWGQRSSAPVTTAAPTRLPASAPRAAVQPPTEPPTRTSEPAPAIPAPSPRRAEVQADDLLERANRLRAEGAFLQARDAYAQVVRRDPSSLSAYAAQVAAGSLELEHLGHPEAARRLFERALRSRPSGALSLEIYQGLAASYAALGHERDEQRTLERLVAAYPDTHAAQRAEARLEALARRR